MLSSAIVNRSVQVLVLLLCATSAWSVTTFDGQVTPDYFNGSGSTNEAFTIDRDNGVEVALRAKLRFNENGSAENTFFSNGDGSYTYVATTAPNRPADTGPWGFEWSVNTDFDDSNPANFNLNDLTYELGLDSDPSVAGTNFLRYDPITPTDQVRFWDHSLGDNDTVDGVNEEGVDSGDDGQDNPANDQREADYAGFISDNNVAQNSWRYAFFNNVMPGETFTGSIADYDARLEGTYDLYLEARDGATVLARVEIQVIVVNPDLIVPALVTPDVIFGSGNANEEFTVDRRNDIEIGIRGKRRYNDDGVSDGFYGRVMGTNTYQFQTGIGTGQGDPKRPRWNFDWSVNSNFNGAAGPNLDQYTYELGIDADPGQGTDFFTFDNISSFDDPPGFFDHSIGNNSTTSATDQQASTKMEYETLIANNNVAQNSWTPSFFDDTGPLQDFDPNEEGVYDIYIAAFDNGVEVARSVIQILVVKPELIVPAMVTPDVIFGSGNANEEFTVDRRNDIEIGIRGKLRFPSTGTYNRELDNTYRFDAGPGPGNSNPDRARWNFDWTVNSNFSGGAGANLDAYTYEIGIDADPSQGTDFFTFDNISPFDDAPGFYDHSIGDNSTDASTDTVATSKPQYETLIANNNVAQNSWTPSFFDPNFDPDVEGVYDIYIAAFDSGGGELARSVIQILVGPAATGGNVADLSVVQVSDAMGSQSMGDMFDLIVTITNEDAGEATGVSLADDLSDNLTFVAGSCDDGSMAMPAGQTINFDLENIAAGENTVCTISVQVTDTGIISSTATVTDDDGVNPANDTDSVQILGTIASTGNSGDAPTPADNDYTRIRDAIELAIPGDVITLVGTFDWGESNAFDSWSLGNDDTDSTGDDFSILIPSGLNGVTVTSDQPGDATIRGPGDISTVDLEGVFIFFGVNTDWTISNLAFENFDSSIAMYFNGSSGGGINSYDRTQLIDNTILMARDVAGDFGLGTDEQFQNIGIHYSFGVDQLIARNVIQIPGDASSDGQLTARSVAMQSNTSGNAYEGLVIEDNLIEVLFAPANEPESILGIWENGNGVTSNITVRNNMFVNLDPDNDPADNLQEGFRITSSSANVVYSGNVVSGAARGFAWLSFASFGADFSARDPIDFRENTVIDNTVGIRIDSNGAANFRCNRIYDNGVGIENITQANRSSDAADNWFGCNAGPGMGACDNTTGVVDTPTWLVASIDATPSTVDFDNSETSQVVLDVTENNVGDTPACSLPETPVAFAAQQGAVNPTNTDTDMALADTTYTPPPAMTTDQVSGTIDAETVVTNIAVLFAEPTVSVADATVDETAGMVTVTVSLSAMSAGVVSVDYATADGSATSPGDYVAAAGTLMFAAGQTTQTFDVMIVDDGIAEADEMFAVNLSNAQGATLDDAMADVTITDDEMAGTLSVNDVSVSEDAGSAVLTVNLSGASSMTVMVDYMTSDGSAIEGSDYSAAMDTLTFAPGQTSATINVPVTDDLLDESAETLSVTLSNPVNASIADGTGLVTILDNDGAPMIGISDVTVGEGAGVAQFAVTLAPASGSTVTVDFTTMDGTATSGSDYTATQGSVVFAPGQTSASVNVSIVDDQLQESTESFSVMLSDANGATIGNDTAVGTITDNDAAPQLSIGDVAVSEADGTAAVVVSLSNPSTSVITVDYASLDGSATSPDDFAAVADTLTFNAGETSQTVMVSIVDDAANESAETFTVNLSNASGATIADASGTVTILDQDGTPMIGVNDVAVTEADGAAQFVVTLSAASGSTVSVDFATADSTAVAGEDYTATSGTVVFSPGQTTRTVNVSIIDDVDFENTETFLLNLSNASGADIGDDSATGTITDNDGPPQIRISDAVVSESDATVTLMVTLSSTSTDDVSVDYATVDGSAVSPDDYTAASGTLTFMPGETSASFMVTIVDDGVAESVETFQAMLSNPVNGAIADDTAVVTLLDDESAPTLAIDDVVVDESDGTATLTVILNRASQSTVTVDFASRDESAEADSDYVATSGTLVFSPGETSESIVVSLIDDDDDEAAETFAVDLDNAFGASIAVGEGTVTIDADNDTVVDLIFADGFESL